MRNLTKTLAAVSLLAPASAYPLGIGDIKLHSALNQNLEAEIALLVSASDNVSNLQVRLAPPEKFDEAGVPWNYFLSKIKFEAVVRKDGSAIVKLSSKEALREPFLDFLLQVSWDKGNLYREFTVLVDPPVAYTQPVIPVIQKAKQIAEKIKPEKINAVVDVDGVVETPDSYYGPTSSRDSLWKIAEKTNVYDDVSIEQMMMAIYEANPKAFYKNNVNALMADQTVTIPEKELILKLSQKEALAAFKQQDNVWKGRVVEKVQVPQPVIEKTEITTQLELEAPVEDEITEAVVIVTENDVSADSAVDAETEKLAVATSEEGLALQARLEKLEQQLMMMQKMLVLKDEQIAALQNQKKGETVAVEPDKNKVPSATTETKEDPKQVLDTANKTAPVTKVEPKTVEKEKLKPKPKPKPVVQPEPETGSMANLLTLALGGAGAIILTVLGWLWWRKRKVEEETDTESMFATASEISLPDSSSEELSVPVMDDTSSYDVGTVGESSFLSEFTPSDFDAFDTDQNEVDPISEADVYLAYGRYQQAEDLMRQAIEDQPDRDECKLKLLEIFYANENKTAFNEYATELVSSGKNKDSEFWDKVVEMGVELDPDSTLYSGNVLGEASFETEAIGSDSVIAGEVDLPENEATEADISSNEVDFDLSVFDENDDEPELKTEEQEDETRLDFDLSVFDIDEAESDKVEETDSKNVAVEDTMSVDFDLDSVSLDDDSSQEEEIKKIEMAETDEIESFDFDLGTDSEVKTSDVRVGEVDLSSEIETDDDLESFDFSLDSEAPGSVAIDTDKGKTVSVEDSKESESFDFDFDFDLDTTPSAKESLNNLEVGVSDLTDMDELETKIDLAKAYIDMGDADAAKGIAEEVLEKGNDEQKKNAQLIIDQLK